MEEQKNSINIPLTTSTLETLIFDCRQNKKHSHIKIVCTATVKDWFFGTLNRNGPKQYHITTENWTIQKKFVFHFLCEMENVYYSIEEDGKYIVDTTGTKPLALTFQPQTLNDLLLALYSRRMDWERQVLTTKYNLFRNVLEDNYY